MDNYFSKLNAINVNDKVEKKNGLTYLSWAYAWGEVKKLYPDANYTIYENADGWNYHTDGRTCWVKTGVTINGIEHIEMLPVMDFRNASILLEKVTSFDVNKAIQRSLTKAVARHGLGLYIYAGEDLPEEEANAQKEETAQPSYTELPEDTYWKFVKAFANGILCPSGKTARDKFIELTHAGEEHIAKFDHDVENFKLANQPQKKTRRKPANNENF